MIWSVQQFVSIYDIILFYLELVNIGRIQTNILKCRGSIIMLKD